MPPSLILSLINRVVDSGVWPAAEGVADQLGAGGGEAQIVGEAVFRCRAQVVLPLLPRDLSSSLNKQDGKKMSKRCLPWD